MLAGQAEFGELVEYTLTFPVDGTHHQYDWFWAGRSHGIHPAQDIMASKMTPLGGCSRRGGPPGELDQRGLTVDGLVWSRTKAALGF